MRRAFVLPSGAATGSSRARILAMRITEARAAYCSLPKFYFMPIRRAGFLMNTSVYRSRVLQMLRFPGYFLISLRVHYVNLYLIIVEIEVS